MKVDFEPPNARPLYPGLRPNSRHRGRLQQGRTWTFALSVLKEQNAFVDPLRRPASWFDKVACHKIVTPNLHSLFRKWGALWPIRPLISVSLLARALQYAASRPAGSFFATAIRRRNC